MTDKILDSISMLLKDLPLLVLLCWHAFIAALPTLMFVFGFVYLMLQIAFLLWKWKRMKDNLNLSETKSFK